MLHTHTHTHLSPLTSGCFKPPPLPPPPHPHKNKHQQLASLGPATEVVHNKFPSVCQTNCTDRKDIHHLQLANSSLSAPGQTKVTQKPSSRTPCNSSNTINVCLYASSFAIYSVSKIVTTDDIHVSVPWPRLPVN